MRPQIHCPQRKKPLPLLRGILSAPSFGGASMPCGLCNSGDEPELSAGDRVTVAPTNGWSSKPMVYRQILSLQRNTTHLMLSIARFQRRISCDPSSLHPRRQLSFGLTSPAMSLAQKTTGQAPPKSQSLSESFNKCVELARSRGYSSSDLDGNRAAARNFVVRCMQGKQR